MSDTSVVIAPSILSADLTKLQEEVESIEPFSDWLQVDVMDGQFVDNLSFGAPVIKNLKTQLLIDAHLMVEDPQERVQEFLDAGARNITFHAEAVQGTDARKALIQAIRDGGATAGIAINPETPLSEVEDVLGEVDLLLVMSVHPGFGGQKFIEDVLEKVSAAREKFPDLMIQMDGGVDDQTAPNCIKAGANNLVSGSFIFKSPDREAAIASLRGT